MTYRNRLTTLVTLATVFLGPAAAQTANVDRVNVPLTDPARPVELKANVLNGSITVKAAATREVIVEARVRDDDDDNDDDRSERRPSGKRLRIATTGLTVEEDNNEVRVSADAIHRTVDLTITVPARTSVNLKSVNNGNISVTGVEGEIDVDNVNGDVTLKDVAGYAVAHALNGELKANFKSVTPGRPMAFSSLNGDIEVTFPADLKANVSLTPGSGDVFSDFDINLQARPAQPVVEDGRGKGGKFRVRIDKTVRGTINGGGPEIQFKNFQGSISIRRAAGAAPAAPAPKSPGD